MGSMAPFFFGILFAFMKASLRTKQGLQRIVKVSGSLGSVALEKNSHDMLARDGHSAPLRLSIFSRSHAL